MADIALRSYLEEIDGLIDGNRVEEAIAHLKHILGIYPKDLDAYRLLAKALLEKNRHLDAADVFQRVLSSVPDDFIAHIGMAVVREDEGNLDAAIWHMERAYEVQPSSGPIQEELRRLFGKRDGGEPPRLRLSRAALARMYEKGDLYQQAIGELRAALKDEPDRLDLKVMLASALWRSKQRAEAAETSAKLLEILPFCKEANRILASVWTESGRPQEAQNYRRRLEALDPYEAFADPAKNGNGAGFVDQDQVQLPHLENVYGGETSPDASRPDWMEALGIQYDQASPIEAATSGGGEWLDALSGQNATQQNLSAQDNAGAGQTLPGTDWLSSLRGEDLPKTGNLSMPQTATPANKNDMGTDTPDWLSGLGISDATEAVPSSSLPAVMGATDWLSDVMGDTGAGGTANNAPASQDVPDWMTEDVSASRPSAQPAEEGTGMTGWLSALSGEGNTEAAPAPTASSSSTDDSDVPDWLKGAAAEESAPTQPSLNKIPDSDVPDWLASATSAAEDSTPTQPSLTSRDSDVPDWMQNRSMAPDATVPMDIPDWSNPAPSQSAAADALPDWMNAPAESESASGNDAGIPDWLAGAASDSEPAAASASDLPDWLSGSASQARSATQAADVPDWLSSNTEEASPAPIASPAPATPSANADLPDWLSESTPATPENAPEDVPTWLNDKPVASDATVPMSDADVPDWLAPAAAASAASASDNLPDWLAPTNTSNTEPVAANAPQAAPAEEFSPTEKAEEMARADEEMPEWMKAAGWIPRDPSVPLDSASNLPEEIEPEAVAEEEVAPAELPDWLQAMKPAEEPKAAKASGDAPDWLRMAMEGGEQPTLAEATPAAVAEPVEANPEAAKPVTADDLPDWLKTSTGDPSETVARFLKDKPATPAAEPDLPDWLQESGAGADSAAATQPSTTPDWRMANEITEATRPVVPAASEDAEDSLSWLKSPGHDTAEAVATYLREQSGPPTLEPVEPATPAATPQAESASPAEMNEDEALAWLEGLAAKQGANEEELVTKPEDRPADWLQPTGLDEIASTAPVAETPTAPEAEAEPATDLPDWLKAPIDAEEQAATPTVPDWLQAPADESESETASTEEVSENLAEAPDWLSSLSAEPSFSELGTKPIGTPEPVAEEEAPAEPATLPDWLTASLETPEAEAQDSQITRPIESAPAIAGAEPAAMSEDEALAWLEGLAAKHGANEEELVTKPEDRPVEAAPVAESEPELPGLPDWLEVPTDTTAGPTAEVEVTSIEIEPLAEVDEPIVDTTSSPEPAPAATPISAEMSADEALAWLEGLAAKQGASAEELVSKPEDRAEEMPTWVQNEAKTLEASTAQTSALSDTAEAQPEPATAEEDLWEVAPEAVEPTLDASLAKTAPLADMVNAEPIQAFESAEPTVDETPLAVAPEADDKPDWLKQMEAESDAYEAIAQGSSPEPLAPPTPQMSEDAALAWLESLAAKQGADPEELVSKPEARAEEMPAWIKHEAEAAESEESSESEYAVEEVEVEETETETFEPEAVEGEEAEAEESDDEEVEIVTASAPVTEEEPLAEVPSWLAQSEPESVAATPEPTASTESDEELPAWLTTPSSEDVDEPLTIAGWTPLTSNSVGEEESEIIDTPAWMRTTDTPEVTIVEVVSTPTPVPQPEPTPVREPEPALVSEPESEPVVATARPKPPKPPAKKAKSPRKTTRRAPRASKLRGSAEPETVLATARKHLAISDVANAVDVYTELINAGQFTPEVINDLEAANRKNPGHPEVLRTLGDAYMRDNQLQKALDAYKQALQQL